MGVATGFTNSFIAGELSDDAWDRVDIQPLAKGCVQAQNFVIRIVGPLGKRRGFWDLGSVAVPGKRSRLIPFRRSVDDALMLEFTELEVRVFNNDGSPLMSGGVQVTFASPYTSLQLAGLRYKQIADVIYFRHSSGLPPQTLVRNSNTSWTWNVESFTNGPWRPENIDQSQSITVTATSGTTETDANPQTGAGSIFKGATVNLVTSNAFFDPGMVGHQLRLRQNDGNPSVRSWAPGIRPGVGFYCLSVGRVYRDMNNGTTDSHVTTPPLVESGDQSDGNVLWEYRHDGAGIVQITAVTNATHAVGNVVATVPFKSGDSTTFFAEGAYSAFRGWPRMWPAVREERIADGATAADPDYLDLTETAGFNPTSQSFKPGVGTGAVVDTDAIRRRLGDDGSELLWSQVVTYLLIGSASAEYLVAGSVLDEPLSPSAVTVKTLSNYGSADVYPVKAHKGLLFVTRGAQTLREITIDTSQGYATDDMTVLVRHIAERGFAQLAWLPQPDEQLWARLNDGGLAVMTYHQEQNVRGWTTQALPPGWTCEDIVTLPGPGRLETLWVIVSRTKAGVTQRRLWMLSQTTDGLFLDGALLYAGAPETTIGGLDMYNGELVRVLADGSQLDDLLVTAGAITLPRPASRVMVGQPYLARFKSLRLNVEPAAHELNSRQRVAGVTASVKTAGAQIGIDGGLMETIAGRDFGDVPAAQARRVVKACNIAADTSRDPHLVIEDDTAFDCVLYSLKPQVTG